MPEIKLTFANILEPDQTPSNSASDPAPKYLTLGHLVSAIFMHKTSLLRNISFPFALRLRLNGKQ